MLPIGWSVRLVYPEARAALAQAQRANRISRSDLRRAAHELEDLISQIDIVEVTDGLAQRAGELALLRSAETIGLAVAATATSA